jgi:hypothetical protein
MLAVAFLIGVVVDNAVSRAGEPVRQHRGETRPGESGSACRARGAVSAHLGDREAWTSKSEGGQWS